MDAIKALLTQIVNFWNGKEKRFKRNVIIISSAVLAVVIILAVVLNQVDYAALYSGLDADDSKAVIDQLETEKVTYKVKGDAILVPAKDADRLRLSLATQVKNGFNLDILAQGQGLGVSEKTRQEYSNYQLQFNLQNAIKTLRGIKDAKVMLTIPEDSALVITADKQYATAGVILTLEEGFQIKPEDVNAVRLFVQKAVPGLKLENISIMDSYMRNLDALEAEATQAPPDMTIEEQRALEEETKDKLRQQVMNLLTPVFGYGRVSAQVNVVLNFDARTSDSEEFKPVVGDTGIIRTIDKVREKIVNGTVPQATGAEPGTTTNTGTGATNGTPTYPVVEVDNGTYEKNTESIQYEITKINTHLEEAKGKLQSLSVAVVVDNTGMKDDLTPEVKDLVAKTVGVSTDFVSVSFMPMVAAQSDETTANAENPAVTQQKNQQLRFFVIVGVIVFVVLLAMVLILLGRKKPKAEALPLPAEGSGMMNIGAEGYGEEEPAAEGEGLAAIELVKDSSAKEQIGKLIERNPELVASLLRTWLSEEQE